jgi:hypothetical protein
MKLIWDRLVAFVGVLGITQPIPEILPLESRERFSNANQDALDLAIDVSAVTILLSTT